MKAFTLPVLSVFETKTRLDVPLFQRQYIWKQDEQWAPLWEDISRKFSEYLEGRKDGPPHFLGAMVLDQKQNATGHVEKRQVIDGQQRLTTLQIVLAAMRDFCSANGCDELAGEFTGYLVNKGMKAGPEDAYKVWPTQLDRQQFQDVIDAGSRSEVDTRYPLVKRAYARRFDPRPRMVEAYCYFYSSISEFFLGDETDRAFAAESPLADRLEECFTALKSALQVVVIDLDRDDDAQVIFETLNARGEPLLPADLLRNYIFLRAARQKENPEALYHEYWESFDDEFWRTEVRQGRLSRPRSDLFIQHFLASRLGTDIPIKHLFVEYKFWIDRKRPFDTVRGELQTLAEQGQGFRRLIDPNPGDNTFAIATVLSRFDTSTAYPLLLRFLATNLTAQEWVAVSRILESYIVRRAVCGLTTKGYNRIFLALCKTVESGTCAPEQLRQELASLWGPSSEWPDDNAFHKAWLESQLYDDLQSQRVVHILARINSMSTGRGDEDITINSPLSIEHIMPQQWTANWPLSDGSAGLTSQELWDSDPEDPRTIASRDRNIAVQTIGNLTVVTQSLNSSVSNNAWSTKRLGFLEGTLLPLNRRLHLVEEWDEKAIAARAEELFQVALEIWPSAKALAPQL